MSKKQYFFVIIYLFITPVLFGSGLATINFNYINDLVGAKAAAMGGSLSVNSFKLKELKFQNAIWSSNDYNQRTASFYPSFFGVVHKIGNMKFAFTLLTKNNELLDQDDYYENGTSTFNMNYNLKDSTAVYNLSGAGFINDTITIGVTISAIYRHSEQIANMAITTDLTNHEFYNQYITEDYYGIKGKFGIQWMPTKNTSLGLSAEVGFILSHNFSGQKTVTTISTNYNNINFSPMQESSNFNDGLPINIRLGFAYFPTKKFLLAADVIADIGYLNYSEHVKTTINGAIGIEYYLKPTLPIRLGLFSNLANTYPVGGFNKEMHVNLYGASMGIGWESLNSSIAVTATYQYGKGESVPILNPINEPVPTSFIRDTIVNQFTISLTGTAKY